MLQASALCKLVYAFPRAFDTHFQLQKSTDLLWRPVLAQFFFDKAAKKGVIKKNTASRKKARLARISKAK
jgi:ribosomal protein S20